jgi:hypothetical protein
MTAENESGDQVGLSLAAFSGNAGTKQAAIGIVRSAVALSHMIAERP